MSLHPMSRYEVSHHVLASLKATMQIGNGEKEIQNGIDFYKFFFTNYPDLRSRFYKGAENFTAEDVQNSERFAKLGQAFLLAIWTMPSIFVDEETFRAYAREIVNRHVHRKLEPNLWMSLFTVYIEFLESRGPVSETQKKAWLQMGREFSGECQEHLKKLGLPYC